MVRIVACIVLAACVGCAKPATPTASPETSPGTTPTTSGRADGGQADGLPVANGTSANGNGKGDPFLAPGAASPEGKPAKPTLDAVEEAIENDEISQARELLDKVLAAEGPSRRGLMLKIQILATGGSQESLRSEPKVAVQKFEECLTLLDQVDKDFAGDDPGETRAWRASLQFLLASGLSLAGEPEQGLAALKAAHENGYSNLDEFEQDEDLKAVRDLPEYATFIAEVQEARRAKVLEKVAAFKPIDVAFEVTDVSGAKISTADLKGKVVLIDCWATWCPPCLKMLPTMKELHAKHHEKGLRIIGLNFEGDEEEEATKTVREFLEKKPAPYPCAVAGDEIASKLPPFAGIPTWFFVDKAGKIRYRTSGAQPAFEMEAVIQHLLDESDAP